MPNAERDGHLKAPLPARGQRGDIVIVSAMAIVSVAFGAGLLVQGGFGFGPSLIGGLGLFVLSMFLHTMMRRLQDVGASAASPSAIDAERAVPQPPQTGRSEAAPPDEADHGWGEPAAVNDLVRQLATELQKTPQPASPSGKAEVRADLGRPMPVAARPLGPEVEAVTERAAAARPAPPRPPAPAAARPIEDAAAVIERAIETEDIEVHLQPVMSLADRRTQLYEAFPRVRDGRGGLMKAETYARVAKDSGLASAVERIAFRRSVQILSRLIEHGKQRPLFCPISASTLRDGSCLRAFHEVLKAGPALAANLILELPEAELSALGPDELDQMHTLANAGFRFSLQDVKQLDMARIGDLPVAFVKVRPIVLHGQPGAAAGLVARIRSIGADPIVDGLLEDRDIAVAQALGVVLGQGSLLSEPRPLKADVIGEVRTGT